VGEDGRPGTGTPFGRIGELPTVYGVCGGRGDSLGGTKGGGEARYSSLRSSHSSASARTARSGRPARILDARINSPRICEIIVNRDMQARETTIYSI
jgi:hypothetical protein